MFDPAEVHSIDEITGMNHWSVRTEDGQEITVISLRYNVFEAAQWSEGEPDPVRVERFLDKQGVLDFIEDVRGNWGLSNPDVCEDFKRDGSCIHSEHTK